MSHLFPNYVRESIEFVKGVDCTLIDSNGKEYLDFTSGIGVNNLGYHHPVLTQALHEQVDKIWHVPNLYASKLQETVAKKLAFGKDYLGFFCNSGAEANEAAIKFARKATGRTNIVSFEQSFHGRTYAAMSATGQEKIHDGFHPLLPGFQYIPYNSQRGFTMIDQNTAAVIIELVQGEGGVLPAEKEWLKKLAEHTKKVGALLIIDEIQTGIGRTGTFYAFTQYKIEPDIFTLAKGLGNGVPIGAMFGKKELGDTFSAGSHGTTFGGNRLALAVANQVIDIVGEPAFLKEVKQKEQLLSYALEKGLANNPHVQAIRGIGLMFGIELMSPELLNVAVSQLQEKGILVLKAGKNVLRLLPPLVMNEESLMVGVKEIVAVLNGLE